MISPEYEKKIADWHLEREDNMRRENGWLALAGLFWLIGGENRIGSDPACEVVLPPRAPARLGTIRLEGNRATLYVHEGQAVVVNGEDVREALLKPYPGESPTYFTLDGMRMVLLDHPNGFGLRIWDNQRPERQTQPPRTWFPINEAMRLPARYTRHEVPRPVLLPDVFGELVETTMDGIVTFEIDGQEYSLEVSETEDGRLDVHFQDLTNGSETYPSGRYLVTREPVVDGRIMMDFNFSYSPPCAFTGYATCAFAPPENHLKVRIEAGEIYQSHS